MKAIKEDCPALLVRATSILKLRSRCLVKKPSYWPLPYVVLFLGEVIEIQSTQTLLIILFFCPYRSIDNVVVKESMLEKITRDFSNLKKKSSINKGII